MAKLKIKETGMKVVGLTAGAVGAGYLQRVIPVDNAKIKSAVPILVGAFLSGKKGIIGEIGAGMIAKGGSDLVASFGIGGDYTFLAQPGQENIINGIALNGTDDAVHSDDQV